MLSIQNLEDAIQITDALIKARQTVVAKMMASRVPLRMGEIDAHTREQLAKIRKERAAVTTLRKAKRILRSYRVSGL